MIDKAELCKKITEIYPDVIFPIVEARNLDVEFDDQQDRWVVHLSKDAHRVKTFLEEGDAELCLMGRQCVSLGIEINQLRDTVERFPD